jgi:hypothetical protein
MRVGRQAEAEDGLRGAGLLVAGAIPHLAEGTGIPAVAAWLVANGFEIESLGCEEKSLEDFYLETTRNGRGEGGG